MVQYPTNPRLWAAWAAGFEAGQAAGRIAGRREVVAALLPAARELAATKPSRREPIDELRRRRTTYPTPPQTADQIRARAASSWAQTEATIRARSATGARRLPETDAA